MSETTFDSADDVLAALKHIAQFIEELNADRALAWEQAALQLRDKQKAEQERDEMERDAQTMAARMSEACGILSIKRPRDETGVDAAIEEAFSKARETRIPMVAIERVKAVLTELGANAMLISNYNYRRSYGIMESVNAIQDALGLGAAKTDTAYTGLNNAIDVVSEIKAKLVAAREPGVDKTKINNELKELKSQLVSVAQSASFSGENWLSPGAAAEGRCWLAASSPA